MSLDAQRWRLARELFETVVDFPASEWQARLLHHCPDDAALRAEVHELLLADAAASQATGLVEQAPLVVAELAQQITLGGTAAPAIDLGGLRLGPFRLQREIGRGGMGAVWLAERVDGQFAQRVAIKLIRGGWDTADTQARFRAERQILAGLQHPHIAHLVDGGVSADGKPWLALEYVEGVDLRRWCDQQRLGLRQRLNLFLAVCDAVAHAHQRLVVHRDLKPSNILVSADGVVKLLDFGIAKLMDAESASISATRIFTPEYAAPEQIRGELVTTSVDIYALGLLLYELLAGRRPYKVDNSTPAAYERAILDQEPTRPSVVLSRDGGGDDEAASLIAAQRDLTPARLRRELRGDLDAIVLKALRKDPRQRYASVADFVADAQRYLRREPVLARRGSWRYRSTRLIQRHALAVGLGLVAILALVGGLGIAVWQAQLARAQRDTARQALNFMTTLFDNADPAKQKGDQLSVRDLLDTGVRNMRHAMPDATVARAELLLTMASAYLGLGQLDAAAPLIDEAGRIAQTLSEPALQASVLIQQCRHLDLKNESEACPALLDRAEALLDARDPDQAKLIAYALSLRIFGLQLDNRYEDMVSVLQRGLTLLNRSPDHRYLRIDLSSNLAFALTRLGRHAEAEAVLQPILTELRADDSAERVLLPDCLSALASAVAGQGRMDEAITLQREAVSVMESLYGKDNPAVSQNLNGLARLLSNAGRPQEAISVIERTVELDRRRTQAANPELASGLCNLAIILLQLERDADSLMRLDEAVQVAEKADYAQELGRSLIWRAALHLLAANYAAARTDQQRMAQVLAATHGADSELMLRNRSLALAIDFSQRGRTAATAERCAQADAIVQAYAQSPQKEGPDARFASFLQTVCSLPKTTDAAARQQAQTVLSAALPRAQDYRARLAQQLLQAWQ